MDADLKKTLTVNGIICAVILVVGLGYFFYSRRDTGTAPKKPETTYSSNMDDYVTPKKIVPYNVESAKKELVDKPIWVKAGNAVAYYPFDSGTKSVNFKKEAGLLPPLAKLDIKDVVLQRSPVAPKVGQVVVVQKQIMAVFQKAGEPAKYAVSIGQNTGDDFTFTVNDLFFFEDPHELYKHWPADVWNAIDQHQAKPGMNELQASFALGTNMSSDGTEMGNRTIEYANAGKPVTVVFEKNKATSVTPGKAP
ncbi:MAG TPA: hypothetical protein VFB79_24230 [Candidatus Angelobacter sp.]|nr:hypothetical protein [Candidatus Angelobacter sp.]